MGAYDWKPEYSVSVSVLDAQHKKLFALAQNLHDAMCAGRGREVLGRCLGELIDYTKTHFAEEEKLLAGHNYPGLPDQKRQHALLIAKIMEFQKSFANGSGMITLEVMDFISGWIAGHIKGTDMLYADFFNRQGVY